MFVLGQAEDGESFGGLIPLSAGALGVFFRRRFIESLVRLSCFGCLVIVGAGYFFTPQFPALARCLNPENGRFQHGIPLRSIPCWEESLSSRQITIYRQFVALALDL